MNSPWCEYSFIGSPHRYGIVSLGWYLCHFDEVRFSALSPHPNHQHPTNFMVWASSVKSPLNIVVKDNTLWSWLKSYYVDDGVFGLYGNGEKITLEFTLLLLRFHWNAYLPEGYDSIKFQIHDLSKEKPKLKEMEIVVDLPGLSFHLVN